MVLWTHSVIILSLQINSNSPLCSDHYTRPERERERKHQWNGTDMISPNLKIFMMVFLEVGMKFVKNSITLVETTSRIFSSASSIAVVFLIFPMNLSHLINTSFKRADL